MYEGHGVTTLEVINVSIILCYLQVWLVAGVSEWFRLPRGADWLMPWSSSQFLEALLCCPSRPACVTVDKLCLSVKLCENAWLLVVFGGTGRGESHFHVASGFLRGPGRNTWHQEEFLFSTGLTSLWDQAHVFNEKLYARHKLDVFPASESDVTLLPSCVNKDMKEFRLLFSPLLQLSGRDVSDVQRNASDENPRRELFTWVSETCVDPSLLQVLSGLMNILYRRSTSLYLKS